MLPLVIVGLLGAGLLSVMAIGGEDGSDPPEVDDPPEPDMPEGDPNLRFDLSGSVELEGDVTEIYLDGSEGSVIAPAEPVLIVGSSGADDIDLSNSPMALVFAGDGDVVHGSDEPDAYGDIGIVIDGDATLHGGTADEMIWVRSGENAVVDGGVGDDLLVSDGDGAQLSGGDGADTIVAADVDIFAHTSGPPPAVTPTTGSDTVDGGDGDDVLIVGDSDVVTSGAGNDTIVSYGKDIDVLDLDPLEDQLEIHLPVPSDYSGPMSQIMDEIDIEIVGNDAVLKLSDDQVATLRGLDDVSVFVDVNGTIYGPTVSGTGTAQVTLFLYP